MNEQLVERIRNCPNLPSLPSIAVEVLEMTQREEVDLAEIARIISRDPALSSKILRTVNSSFYGRSQHVGTISHAMVILGLQSVKSLVLGFSLVTTLAKNKSKGFKHLTYWKHSIYAATASRTLAAKVGLVQAEEAFLAALLMDIGMLVLDQVLEEQYSELHTKAKSHLELTKMELETLGMSHADVGGMLTQQWKLPPLLAVPVAHHHTPELVTDPTLRKLAEVVSIGGRCADVFVETEPAEAIAAVRSFLEKNYQINEADADAILKDIGARTKEVAGLFEINVGTLSEYEAILKKANEALVSMTLQAQQHAAQLQEQNTELKQKATTDGLTGLANRATFDQFLAKELALAVQNKKPFSLLLIDLDKFKSINDKHGHLSGDSVLRAVSKLLKSAARQQDLAARYGGEELVLLLPGAPRTIAAAVAESIRRAVSAQPVITNKVTIPVTCSIGVATYEVGSPLREAAHIIKAADLAVYNAKHSGRNCVKVFTLKPAAPAVPKTNAA